MNIDVNDLKARMYCLIGQLHNNIRRSYSKNHIWNRYNEFQKLVSLARQIDTGSSFDPEYFEFDYIHDFRACFANLRVKIKREIENKVEPLSPKNLILLKELKAKHSMDFKATCDKIEEALSVGMKAVRLLEIKYEQIMSPDRSIHSNAYPTKTQS